MSLLNDTCAKGSDDVNTRKVSDETEFGQKSTYQQYRCFSPLNSPNFPKKMSQPCHVTITDDHAKGNMRQWSRRRRRNMSCRRPRSLCHCWRCLILADAGNTHNFTRENPAHKRHRNVFVGANRQTSRIQHMISTPVKIGLFRYVLSLSPVRMG